MLNLTLALDKTKIVFHQDNFCSIDRQTNRPTNLSVEATCSHLTHSWWTGKYSQSSVHILGIFYKNTNRKAKCKFFLSWKIYIVGRLCRIEGSPSIGIWLVYHLLTLKIPLKPQVCLLLDKPHERISKGADASPPDKQTNKHCIKLRCCGCIFK